MRILIVSQNFWPETFRINTLARRLQQDGHDVRVLTALPNYGKGRFYRGYSLAGPYNEMFGDIPVYRCPVIPRYSSGFGFLSLNYLSAALSMTMRGLTPAVAEVDICLVYQMSPITVALPALAIKRAYDIPVVLWICDLWPETVAAMAGRLNRVLGPPLEWLCQTIYSQVDRILIKNHAYKKHLVSRNIDPRIIDYMPDVAEKIFKPVDTVPADIEEQLPRGLRLTFAGNIGKAQSIATIIQAADRLKHLDDIQWVLLGEGSDAENIRQQIDRLGLHDHVTMLGHKPLASMPYYYAASDAMLVTTQQGNVFDLTSPAKLSSYFAAGRPVIASAGKATTDIVLRSGAGLVSDPEDAYALAENVLTFRELSPAQRQEMGLRGREYAAVEYDYEEHYSNLVSLFKRMVQGR